jgi:hypothetical protein
MPVLDFTQLETVVSAKATIIKKKKMEKKEKKMGASGIRTLVRPHP